jgi:hypothetical protein
MNNRIKGSRIFKPTLSFKLKNSIERIKSLGPKKLNRSGLGSGKLYPTISNEKLFFLSCVRTTEIFNERQYVSLNRTLSSHSDVSNPTQKLK